MKALKVILWRDRHHQSADSHLYFKTKERNKAPISQAGRTGPTVASGYSSGVHPDGHISSVVWGYSQAIPKQGKSFWWSFSVGVACMNNWRSTLGAHPAMEVAICHVGFRFHPRSDLGAEHWKTSDCSFPNCFFSSCCRSSPSWSTWTGPRSTCLQHLISKFYNKWLLRSLYLELLIGRLNGKRI